VIHGGVATAVLLGRVGLHPQLYLEATTITDDMIALRELLENGSDATLLVSVSRSADRATRQIHRSSRGNLDHAPAAFKHKIDEAVLALLYLTLHDGDRAWKGHDWDALDVSEGDERQPAWQGEVHDADR